MTETIIHHLTVALSPSTHCMKIASAHLVLLLEGQDNVVSPRCSAMKLIDLNKIVHTVLEYKIARGTLRSHMIF